MNVCKLNIEGLNCIVLFRSTGEGGSAIKKFICVIFFSPQHSAYSSHAELNIKLRLDVNFKVSETFNY